MREWLDTVELPTGQAVATFDTRLNHSWLPGSAGHAVMLRLLIRGATAVSRPASFHVAATAGPLEEGELERAQVWGHHLAEAVAHDRAQPAA